MANVKAKADKESSSSDVKYSFFAGRWQPLHKGHLWLINPWTAEQILEMVKEGELKDLIKEGKVLPTIIPDIESINYGRGVGYDIIEHVPPTEIGEISATSIRNQMKKDGSL